MTEQEHWADSNAKAIIDVKKTYCVASGISPSGPIHVGNLREVATADALYRAIQNQGKSAEFIYVADDYDPLRKVYPFLDAQIYEKEVGRPLSEIPAPDQSETSYASYFLKPFLQSLERLGIVARVVKASEMYQQGLYTENIMKCLERKKDILDIISRLTGKPLDDTWSAFMPICEKDGRMDTTRVLSFNPEKKTIHYHCQACDNEGERKIAGGGKLTWRLDWPARWQILGVTVEPFGKDHGSKGGSYDTGKLISKEIFDYEAPYPLVYEWISLKGQGDMSSSKGNVISIGDMISIMPPEVLKYWIFKANPKKALGLDPGLPLLSLIDEFDDPEAKNTNPRAKELAMLSSGEALGVPFKHLISLCQIYNDSIDDIMAALARSGYETLNPEVLSSRITYALKWLQDYAPDDIKFEIQKTLPETVGQLSDVQKEALRFMGANFPESQSAQEIHELIYKTRDQFHLEPKDVFEAVYLSILARSRGPRAGFFLSSLNRDFVVQRFLSV